MNESVKKFLLNQFPAILWAIFIFILSSIPGHKLPKFAHLVNDKIEHTTFFFVLGVLVYRAFLPAQSWDRLPWARATITVIVVIVYGLLDEFHQGFVPDRTKDIFDALADGVGGIIAAGVMFIHYHRAGSNA